MNAPIAHATDSLRLTYTVFPDPYAKSKQQYTDCTWDEVVLLCNPTTTFLRKELCPLISLGAYGDARTDAESLRHQANLLAVHGIECDYDAMAMSMEVARQKLQAANLVALLYTTARHTPDRPRWRALLPLSQAAQPADRALYVARVNQILDGVLADESFTLSQAFYIGRVRGVVYETAATTGRCVDLASDISPLYSASRTDAEEYDPTTDAELRQAFNDKEGRHEAMVKLSSRWAARGMQQDDIEANLVQLLGKPNKKDRAKAREMAKTAVKKFGETRTKAPADVALLDELNRHHALVWIGGELVVLWRNEWDGTLPRLSRIGHMAQYYRNRVVGKINPFNAWLESPSRKEFSSIVFEPGEQQTPGAFNLFTGWAEKPREGDCSLMLELLRDVWCAGDEGAFVWVQDWFADLYQNPDCKPGTAIATVSKPGGGKNAVYRYISRTLGRYCSMLAGSDSILGHFNDHLAGRLLIFGDEAVWPRDKRGAAKLKSYISETTLSIERKHVPRVDVASHARFIFATNDDLAAPTELDDRRYTVLRLAEHRVHDRKFWDAFHAELNAGGPAAFAWHCLNHVKITSDLRTPYDTAALAEQKMLNLDHVGSWWLEMLGSEEHEMPDVERSGGDHIVYLRWSFGKIVETKTLHRFYLQYAQRMRVQFPASPTELGVALVRRYLPLLAKREARADERRHLEVQGRAYVYDLPSVHEAREAFEQKIKRKLDWPPGDEL